MNAESKFNEIVAQFNSSIQSSVQDALSSIQSEMVPYLNEDTACNARYRATDIVNSIVRGEAEVDGNRLTCGSWSVTLTDYNYDKIVNALATVAGDKAKDLKIKQLESRIKELLSYER